MYLSYLLVRNFRNIQEANLNLCPGILLFLGDNAQGKTSLIEAILFLATSTSHRTRSEDELIRWEEDTAYLRGEVEKPGKDGTTLECGLDKKHKVLKIDGGVLSRVGDLYGCLRTILFAPEDLAIVGGNPQNRRRFLDMAIAQLDPSYITLLHQFRKALRQRNRLLKRIQGERNSALRRELDVWDRPYVDYAAQVILRRQETIQRLSPFLQEFYDNLAPDGPLRISYSFAAGTEEDEIRQFFQKRLECTRLSEIDRGSTQLGPHRDDLLFLLNGKNLALYGSQGQRRSAALAMRMAEVRLFTEYTGIRPLLLIDDVVHEMDNNRRAGFWSCMDLSGQLIVAATDLERIGPRLNPAKVFEVKNGTISST